MLEPVRESIALIGSELDVLEQLVKGQNTTKKHLSDQIAAMKSALLQTIESVKQSEEDIQEFKLNTLATSNPQQYDGSAVVAIRSPFSIYKLTS